MKPRVSAMVLLAATAGALSLSSLLASETPSEKSAHELARALHGRTAAQPVACIPNFRVQARRAVIDDGKILFREGSTLYLQRQSRECRGIDDGGYTLVSRHDGNQQLCSGDIQQLVELTTGIQAGSCTFGPFVPDRKTG